MVAASFKLVVTSPLPLFSLLTATFTASFRAASRSEQSEQSEQSELLVFVELLIHLLGYLHN